MATMRNIFACSVHESPECIVDLVCNLNYLDPGSVILLYNGGTDPGLLDSNFPSERYGAVLHPQPCPQRWGRLHGFALDCMQFALDYLTFDTLTFVDSDQLAVRPDYSGYLAQFLEDKQGIGLLSSWPERQPLGRRTRPVASAFREIKLWRHLLRRFPQGEHKFVYRSFWAATVFTVEAARGLTRLVAADTHLQYILGHTKIWMTEEIILPTLVALLGYKIMANPCSYDYVKFRTPYTQQQVDAALNRSDVFWIHPIPRRYDDKVRQHIRARFNNYEPSSGHLR